VAKSSTKQAGGTLTRLELEIMQVLWDCGPSTIAEVQAKLGSKRAYTTVQTMLTILLKKGKVERTEEGRRHRYAPLVSRERAVRTAVHDLVTRLFGGSAEALLMAMVDTRQITADEIARAAELLTKREEER
jgi:BlaI family transcriptional regulator, penicillinase repressor